MKTFDYAAAWREVARPAYNALPADVLALVHQTAEASRGLNQGPDLAMAWPPDAGALRGAFEAIEPGALALAAHVVYFTGHWWSRHARGVELPGRDHGAHWKFSHYADQVLRARWGMPNDAQYGGGLHFEIHQGMLRLCYSSREIWTWVEVAPASDFGHAASDQYRAKVQAAILNERTASKREAAAYQAIEDLRGNPAIDDPAWVPWLDMADRYMVEEGDQAPDPDAPPVDVAAIKAAAIEGVRLEAARKVAKTERERDGKIWFLERDIPTDNLIFYSHEHGGAGVWCFGWRTPVGPALLSRILDVISEFPEGYRIKTHDGRTLEGHIV